MILIEQMNELRRTEADAARQQYQALCARAEDECTPDDARQMFALQAMLEISSAELLSDVDEVESAATR